MRQPQRRDAWMSQVLLRGYLKGVLLNMVMMLAVSLGCALGVSLDFLQRVSLPSPLGNGDKWVLSSPQVLVQQRVCLFRAFQHLGSFQRRGTSNPTRVFKINPTFLHKRTCRFSPLPSLVGSSDHVRSSASLGGIFTQVPVHTAIFCYKTDLKVN